MLLIGLLFLTLLLYLSVHKLEFLLDVLKLQRLLLVCDIGLQVVVGQYSLFPLLLNFASLGLEFFYVLLLCLNLADYLLFQLSDSILLDGDHLLETSKVITQVISFRSVHLV